jgi:hypothetical protein
MRVWDRPSKPLRLGGSARYRSLNRFIAEWKIIGGNSVETAVPHENPDLNPDLKQKLGQGQLSAILHHFDFI